jgi:hypothetical protein
MKIKTAHYTELRKRAVLIFLQRIIFLFYFLDLGPFGWPPAWLVSFIEVYFA